MTDQHTTVQYQLRLPENLREQLRESAKNHNRSINADIVARLEQSFTGEFVTTETQNEWMKAMQRQSEALQQSTELLNRLTAQLSNQTQ